MPFVGSVSSDQHSRAAHISSKDTLVQAAVAYGAGVKEREFVWQLSGLSWLPYSLQQEGRECAESKMFEVDFKEEDSRYILVFSPHAGCLNHSPDDPDEFTEIEEGTTGTLALVRKQAYYGSNLFVTFYVRDAKGDFVQWGHESRLALPARGAPDGGVPGRCCVLGPDVQTSHGGGQGGARGVFGLTYEELLASGWVQGDAITVKVAIKEMVMPAHPEEGQVRVGEPSEINELAPRVQVPASSLADDLLSMLEDERHADLTLEAVYGDSPPVRLACHASVLSQRSPVFRAALASGMAESASRTITVRDVPPTVLKALLYFLYTDSFAQVRRVLREEEGHATFAASSSSTAAASAASAAASAASTAVAASAVAAANHMSQLQAVLAAAHKYQVTRLLRWSEAQLCELIRVETVCSLLALAHLYEGPELEEHCLHFLKANTAAVVERPEFATLPPRSLVKWNMWAAGVDPADSRKRPRGAE